MAFTWFHHFERAGWHKLAFRRFPVGRVTDVFTHPLTSALAAAACTRFRMLPISMYKQMSKPVHDLILKYKTLSCSTLKECLASAFLTNQKDFPSGLAMAKEVKAKQPKGSPKQKPKASPKLGPKASPKLGPKASPKLGPKASPKLGPKTSPKLASGVPKTKKRQADDEIGGKQKQAKKEQKNKAEGSLGVCNVADIKEISDASQNALLSKNITTLLALIYLVVGNQGVVNVWMYSSCHQK